MDIDIFASSFNKQLPKYVSWMPDPESCIIDCMNTYLENTYIYAFPPFSMVWPTFKKIDKRSRESIDNCARVANTDLSTRALELATATPIIIES